MDRSRWERLNPLLDELLDLDPAPRAERLASLGGQDPDVARQLDEMLQRMEALEHDTFLQRPPSLPAEPGMEGQTLGAYTIVRELGRGGMGSVWLAQRTDGRYEGNVAVKFLSGGAALRGSAERFAREGSILARLAHPNIARLIDAGVTADGQRYLVLEYIDGEPIDPYVDRLGLDVTARVRLFIDVLAAVAHAHNRLILHRDIKPANILVTGSGEVKLLDFGIAKLMDDGVAPAEATELTQLAGRAYTPAYAAPEQVEDGDVTTATDVYALGVLLYGLLGGGHPTVVPGATPLEQLRAVVEAEPRRLSEVVGRQTAGSSTAVKRARELRGDLDNIVAKALKKAPAERYANAQQLADDLRRYLGHEPVSARADAPGYLLAKFVRRHQAGVAAGAVVVVALVTGIGVALSQASEARKQRLQAEGLIEFMLGDLRKKLQPVGRLDVLDAVGEKALAYYAAQGAARMDDDALGRRARALHLIGEIADRRGKLDVAQKVFDQAAASTAELLARAPDDSQRLFEHAQSVFWVGQAAVRRADFVAARTAFEKYLMLARALRAKEPSNLDWQVEEASASNNLGIVLLQSMRTADAAPVLDLAASQWLLLAKRRPPLHWDHANALGWVAKAAEMRGDYSAALDVLQAKLASLQSVPDAGTSRRVQELNESTYRNLSRVYLALGHPQSAAGAARQAQRINAELAALDPSNADWQAQLGLSHALLAQALWALGQPDQARRQLAQAAAAVPPWREPQARHGKWYVWLYGTLANLAVAQAPAGEQAAVTEALRDFVLQAGADDMGGAGLRSDRDLIVAQAQILWGDRLAGTDAAAAARQWQAAASRLALAGQHADPAACVLLGHAQWRLGDAAAARAWAARIESTSYRHPAYAELRQHLALPAGGGAEPPSRSHK